MELSNITIDETRIYIDGVPVVKVAGLEETCFVSRDTGIDEVSERDNGFVVRNENSGFWVRLRLSDYLDSLRWLVYTEERAQ